MINATISLQDFEATNRHELEKLRKLASAGDTSSEGDRRFAEQSQAIEQVLRSMFQCAAMMARKTESLEDTSDIWRRMMTICDLVLGELRELTQSHPQCSSQHIYDYALDCRNAAARRMELHR